MLQVTSGRAAISPQTATRSPRECACIATRPITMLRMAGWYECRSEVIRGSSQAHHDGVVNQFVSPGRKEADFVRKLRAHAQLKRAHVQNPLMSARLAREHQCARAQRRGCARRTGATPATVTGHGAFSAPSISKRSLQVRIKGNDLTRSRRQTQAGSRKTCANRSQRIRLSEHGSTERTI